MMAGNLHPDTHSLLSDIAAQIPTLTANIQHAKELAQLLREAGGNNAVQLEQIRVAELQLNRWKALLARYGHGV